VSAAVLRSYNRPNTQAEAQASAVPIAATKRAAPPNNTMTKPMAYRRQPRSAQHPHANPARRAVEVARRFAALGFGLTATRGTASALRAAGLPCKMVLKVNEGRPNVVDLLKGGSIQLAIYTTTGAPAFQDEKAIRKSAVTCRVPCITTLSGARAAADAVAARRRDPIRVWSLQEIHAAKTVA
jgi:hypothetical protein